MRIQQPVSTVLLASLMGLTLALPATAGNYEGKTSEAGAIEEPATSGTMGEPTTSTEAPEGSPVEGNPIEDSVEGVDVPAADTPEETETPTAGTEEEASERAEANIVELAANSDSFKMLTQAIQAAGLEATLAGDGPYTVFAPTDAAFEALPEGAWEALLKPENQDLLAETLTYHVAVGELKAADLQAGEVQTANGGAIAVELAEDEIIVNDGSVTQADIEASNGVIHAINRVLLPPDVKEQLSSPATR